MAAAAARSVFRSTAARSAAARLTGGVKSKPKRTFSSLGISNQKPLSRRIFSHCFRIAQFHALRLPPLLRLDS